MGQISETEKNEAMNNLMAEHLMALQVSVKALQRDNQELKFELNELQKAIRLLTPTEQSQDCQDSTLLSQQIQFTHLPSRIQIAFQYNNILTYEQLSNASPFDILTIPNVGAYSYHKLKRHLLQKFGRAFCERNFAQHEI